MKERSLGSSPDKGRLGGVGSKEFSGLKMNFSKKPLARKPANTGIYNEWIA
jgi:hypothetical protein